MEDFPVLLIFFLFYLILGSSGKKKKQQSRMGRGQAGPARAWVRRDQKDKADESGKGQTLEGAEAALAKDLRQADHACEGERIHLHEVSQTEMQFAAEGEDPCHAGDSAAQEQFDFSIEDESVHDALRRDVLRGVIMSEILMRPHERRALKRKEYHG